MSGGCPENVRDDSALTPLGQCLDILRTPRVRVHAGAPPVPTRPDPSLADPSGSGLFSSSLPNDKNSPDPKRLPAFLREEPTIAVEVWQLLVGGLRWLSENDYGRDWPLPRRDVLRRLIAENDADLCLKAARECREIVQSQDRAPNVTALFEKKLLELAEVRATVRRDLVA